VVGVLANGGDLAVDDLLLFGLEALEHGPEGGRLLGRQRHALGHDLRLERLQLVAESRHRLLRLRAVRFRRGSRSGCRCRCRQREQQAKCNGEEWASTWFSPGRSRKRGRQTTHGGAALLLPSGAMPA
jgi:hypothetical protein